jgi:hypothetical protein
VNPESQADLKREIAERLVEDRRILDELRDEIRPLRSEVRRIQPRTSTSISLVGADGGNNRIQFDPFLVQLVRVVDSSNNEYCLEAITPTTSVAALSERQFGGDGRPATPLGNLMDLLDCRDLTQLSHMIRSNDDGRPTSPSWVQVYRELMEWAILLVLVQHRQFGTDTLIVFDGLLRSKVFARDLFRRYIEGIRKAIDETYQRDRRRIFLVGMAKHSKVLTRYRLAMALEGILTTEYPAFLEIPREIEEKAYLWSEYARGNDIEREGGEINKFVGGKMFFVKFGSSPHDPIWPVDVFAPQVSEAQTVLGHMLSDAINGFPIPFYPRCLQKAHENAALVDFDFDMLQDHVLDGLRGLLGSKASTIDAMRMQELDPAQSRYS